MNMYQSIVKTVSTSLISGLIILLIFAFLEFVRRYPLGKRVYHFLSTREKTIIYFLMFVFFLLPVIFSLPKGTLLSPSITASFVRETFVSLIIFASFYFS